VAKQSGKVRKGTNETTKAIERGIAKLVVIAEDVEPPEVVAHLPILCEERNSQYIFVPSKQQLGMSLGIDVGSAAATIIEPGEAQHIIEQVVNSISGLKAKKE
jgi:large subunit ribosomal protein L7Ae